MMPRTIHGMSAMECLSALQKCIRRGMEREAFEFAVELLHTSKPYCSMICKRLQVIVHEDLDCIEQPWLIPMSRAVAEQMAEWYEQPNPGKARMALGNLVTVMCRAKKSRRGDHFQSAIGWRSLLLKFKPPIPDFVYDKHTTKGRAMGRGMDFFRKVSTLLVPEPEKPDPFEDEAYEMWALKEKYEKEGKWTDRGLAPEDQVEENPTPLLDRHAR
jgi:replication-associated recombination protein RarA